MATILGTNANDVIAGGIQNDILNGLAGADTMTGGKGNDLYHVDNLGDTILENAGEGVDTVVATVALSTAYANVENYDFSKLKSGVDFTGNALNNDIKGTSGTDTLAGGTGSDIYHLNSKLDYVSEAANSGNDTIVTTFSADLADYANVENICLLGSAALNATGDAAGNRLEGNNGANILDGKGGADTMTGGKGNDTYYVHDIGDSVIEDAGGGKDTVLSSVSYGLAVNIENLTLTSAANINGFGNNLNNVIVGNEGNNVIFGGLGADTMKGGKGDDAYYVDNAKDKVIENANEGEDWVVSTVDFSIASLTNIEKLQLDATALKATGNARSNEIYGNFEDNVINGGAGADTMAGGSGNDIYYVDNAGDVVTEAAGGGTDTIISTIALADGIDHVENYDFSKLKSGISFIGNNLDNVIKGTSGVDFLRGELGDDTYYLNTAKDEVMEEAVGGTDTMAVTFSADLSDYANIENIRLLGSAALKATGDSSENVLEGNSGANILDGKGAADTMAGGKGNDTYYVDHAGDWVVEYAKEGTDTVISSVTHVLDANIENLILAGVSNINGIGNALNNVITGNEGNNTISGLDGADTMKGGAGDDTYYVDNAKDKVIEKANEGNDAILSFVDFSLVSFAEVENLYLQGTAIRATGNAKSNLIYGNFEDNILNGGAGADSMAASLGDDTYYVDNAGDLVTEGAGEGIDTIISTIAFNNAIVNVENYDFSKLSKGINFAGNSLDNEIKGGMGVDTLTGGLGNDTYYLNSSKDVVIETLAGGTDTIATTFSANLADYANIENIRLLGAAGLKATGNISANLLEGNAGANILDGKGGADTMRGGKGNDTYYVESGGDLVVELINEGKDTVISSISHTLDANVENLTLAGISDLDGHGNALNNVLAGNSGQNTLDGKAGADTMKGGKGDDTYYVDNVGDKVIELTDQGDDDSIVSSINFSLAPLINVENIELTGAARNATGNARNNYIIGNGIDNVLDGGAGADTLIGRDGNDVYFVDNLSDLVSELTGEGYDTVKSTIALSNAYANVENYDFSKAKSAVNFTGNDLHNHIWSSAFSDTLAGGKGDDTYFLNNAGDQVVEFAGQGDEWVYTSQSVAKLWDNVESVSYVDGFSTKAWNATGNDLDNILVGNFGKNVLDGGIGDDFLVGDAGNDTLTGGAGADGFVFYAVSSGNALSGHDVITDFESGLDLLWFDAHDRDGNGTVGEEDVVAGILDHGAGKDVVLQLLSGGSITFKGIGTGAIDSLTDLVSDPANQITYTLN